MNKNRKNIFTLALASIVISLTGCSGSDFPISKVIPGIPIPQTEPVICGGKTDRTDYRAPKEIKSKDLTSFSTKFFLYGDYGSEGDAQYWFKIEPDDNGKLRITEQYCYEEASCDTDKKLMDKIQELIDKYELVKMNGIEEYTNGLPPEYQPSFLEAKYASGESLYYCTNNDPRDPFNRELLKLFAEEYAAHGDDRFMPPKETTILTRFQIEFTDGDMRYRIGELQIPKEDVHKSFEELVTEGYKEGEYVTVIEIDPWDRTGKSEPKTVFRVPNEHYYEDLQKVIEETGLKEFDNGSMFPTGFDYEGTPDYYEFYGEYEYGNRIYGFSDDPEDNKKIAPVVKAIFDYANGYIQEDPQVMEW